MNKDISYIPFSLIVGCSYLLIRATISTRWIFIEILIYLVLYIVSLYIIRHYISNRTIKTNGIIGGVLITLIFHIGLVIWEFSAPEPEELARPIHTALKDYSSKNGKFPKSLNALDINIPKTRYGSFEYRPIDRGYKLKLGEYSVDSFEATWNCDLEQCEYDEET